MIGISRGGRAIPIAIIGLVLIALVGAGLYGTVQAWSNRPEHDCQPAAALTERLRPLARGEIAAFEVAERPERLDGLAFTGPDGRPASMADFRGRAVLLNLWATWCAPCKQEMPALDALQGSLGGPGFEVVAVNIDTRNRETPPLWLKGAGVTRLSYFSDPEARIFQDLRRAGQAQGMPTTLLFDRAGCRLGTMSGGAAWSSPDGLALIRAAL